MNDTRGLKNSLRAALSTRNTEVDGYTSSLDASKGSHCCLLESGARFDLRLSGCVIGDWHKMAGEAHRREQTCHGARVGSSASSIVILPGALVQQICSPVALLQSNSSHILSNGQSVCYASKTSSSTLTVRVTHQGTEFALDL